MIVDLERFVAREAPYWDELEAMLDALERDSGRGMALDEARRLHYLYERTASDLARLARFPGAPRLRLRLDALVARAYGEIHETRRRARLPQAGEWAARTFPRTFRLHRRAFYLSAALLLIGAALGAFAIGYDADARPVLFGQMPHLEMDPAERVAFEEQEGGDDALAGYKSQFASALMTHNTRVAIGALAFGVTWGIGTSVLLFYNGTLLGAVAWDYLQAGQAAFLAGWLLPHGAVEIPAIVIAGQAGLVLGGAVIGWGDRRNFRERMRAVSPDLVTLIAGVALLLVWAGIVEAFLSQHHEPVIPYAAKIAFGVCELVALTLYLTLAGRKPSPAKRGIQPAEA